VNMMSEVKPTLAKILSVGAGRNDYLPERYKQFDITTLDIDPGCNPHIVLDARKLKELPPDTYNGIFCGHNLEHYYAHDVPIVLEGMFHVLKPGGYVEIIVPDIIGEFKRASTGGYSMSDGVYPLVAGPEGFELCLVDIIYGSRWHIAQGNEGWAHKTGFSRKMLTELIRKAGFVRPYACSMQPEVFAEIHAYGWKP